MAASQGRRFVSDWLEGRPADDAALVTCELVTNAVRHGSGLLTLRVHEDAGRLRISVTSPSAGEPVRRDAGPDEATGRGLAIVDKVADEWGWSRDGDLLTVWAELGITPPDAR